MIDPRVARLPSLRAPSLSTQILFAMTLLAAVVALIAGLVVRQVERGYLDSLLTGESRHKFELLLSATQDDIVSQDIPQLQTAMDAVIARDPAVFAVRVANDKGRVLYDRRRSTPTAAPHLLSMVQSVAVDGENFGTLAVDWDIGFLENATAGHPLLISAVVGSTCIWLALLVYLAIRALAVTPIQRMAGRLAEFQRGILDRVVRLPAFTPTELRQLDASINTLGDLLAHSRQRDEERAAAQQAAIAANRTKSEFLANMSHELRTPLNAIIGFSEVMEQQLFGPIGDDKYREYAGDICDAGHHLLALVADLLDVCKIEAGKLVLEEDEVALEAAVTTAMRFVKARAEDAGVGLAQDLPPGLPRLQADERKLKQILLNLLTNAVKFTDRGGCVTLTVRLDKGVVIEVADTGVGIPADKIARVLEPFGQLDNPLTRRHDGAGLGLPLAKALVELHGGTLELESEVGVGTRVRVTLPASRILEQPATADNIIRLPRAPDPDRGGRAAPARDPKSAGIG